MENLMFYHINEGYIEFLHKLDRRVQFNKGERRPYVGVVLDINAVSYYVPLESPKESHKDIKSGGPVLKLEDGALGIMGFNNMIPVERKNLIEFDINEVEDKKYNVLLQKQLAFCRKNKILIYTRAKSTYVKATCGKIPFYRNVCCDFKKLEENYKLFARRRK